MGYKEEMGMKKKIVTLGMMAVLAGSLVACKKDPVQGTWNLEKATIGSEEVTQEQLQSVGLGGTSFAFEDGKVTIQMESTSEVSEGTYEVKDDKVTVSTDNEATSFSGTIEKDTLTIDIPDQDETLVFKKK